MRISSLERRISAVKEKAEELLSAAKRQQQRDEEQMEATMERVRELKSKGIM